MRMLNLTFDLTAARVDTYNGSGHLWCLEIKLHICVAPPRLLFFFFLCVTRQHAWATFGVEPRGTRRTGGHDVMRIDCDQAGFVLTQVCHQMTVDDRQSAVSSCWMPLTSPRSSGDLAHAGVLPIHLLSKRKHFLCKAQGRWFVFPL